MRWRMKAPDGRVFFVEAPTEELARDAVAGIAPVAAAPVGPTSRGAAVVRWILVLPTAIAGGWLVSASVNAAAVIFGLRESRSTGWQLLNLISLVGCPTAFVLLGRFVAPREDRGFATMVLIAILVGLLGLVVLSMRK